MHASHVSIVHIQAKGGILDSKIRTKPVFWTKGGVIRPMMKLFSQFEHVDSATPFARRLLGKISDGIAPVDVMGQRKGLRR